MLITVSPRQRVLDRCADPAAMEIMMEETFGPTIGIMKVESDDEALALMNDSPYGLVRARGAPFPSPLPPLSPLHPNPFSLRLSPS
jgi:hypothetical protein